MARPHIEPFCDRDVPFKKMNKKGFGTGMHFKMLSMDTDTDPQNHPLVYSCSGCSSAAQMANHVALRLGQPARGLAGASQALDGLSHRLRQGLRQAVRSTGSRTAWCTPSAGRPATS